MVADENSEQTVDEQNEAVNAENSATDEKVEPDEQSPETLVTESIEESSEEDLEAKMAAAMSGKIDDSEDDLEAQMAASMAGEIDDSEDGIGAQMAAAMSDESDESMCRVDYGDVEGFVQCMFLVDYDPEEGVRPDESQCW